MNILDFIDEQLKERYKNLIIYGPALEGKTKLGQVIAEKKNGLYIDLLQVIKTDDEIKRKIDTYNPNKFESFLGSYYKDGKNLIIIDQMDFLVNVWDDKQLEEFLKFVERSQEDYCCIFILQTHNLLKKYEFLNDKGKSRIINIYEIRG